jgi:excisionase family DNA binding protein
MGSDLPISKVMKDESTRGPTSERAAGFLRRRSGAGVASAQPPVSTELIDINELSRRLSVARGTLYNWVYLRRIPFVKAGRCVRFDYGQVLETLHQYPIIDTSVSGRRII